MVRSASNTLSASNTAAGGGISMKQLLKGNEWSIPKRETAVERQWKQVTVHKRVKHGCSDAAVRQTAKHERAVEQQRMQATVHWVSGQVGSNSAASRLLSMKQLLNSNEHKQLGALNVLTFKYSCWNIQVQ